MNLDGWKNNIGFWLGTAGVIFSLMLSIWFSAATFLDPLPPYVFYDHDLRIAILYLVIFSIVGFLSLIQKPCWLGTLTIVSSGGMILVAAKTPSLAVSLLLLLWFLWSSWCIGEAALRWLVNPEDLSAGEGAALAIVLGWGVLVVLTLFLGVIGLYQRWLFYALFSLITIWGLWKHKMKFRQRRSNRLPGSGPGALASSLLAVVAAGSFFWALAPAVRYDSLSYHLAVPLRYLEAGRMLELPESFQMYFAHYGEMLYLIAFALGDQPLPGLINFSAGILLTIQTYFLGKRLANRTLGWIAAVILYSLPIIGIESATTYVDIFIALFVTSALHAALLWSQGKGGRWLFLTGIFSGLALGTKLNAFLLLLPFWLWTFTAETRSSRSKTVINIPRSLHLRGEALLSLGLPALLLWAPWLARDWFWTGNPIFPNLNAIFRSPEWFDRHFFVFQPTLNTLQGILFFPWLGVADSHRYYHEAPGAVLGALPMLSLPWFYGWRIRRSQTLSLFFAFCAAMALLFGFGANARYLMPLFPLLSVLAASNVESFGEILFRKQKHWGAPLVFLALLYVFSTRLAFTARWWEIPERYPIRIWLGQESQEHFVERVLPVYGAFEFLNQQGRFKVFSVGNELRLYTASEIYGILFSKEAHHALHDATTPDELAQNLAREGYDYLLIYPPEQEHRPEIYTSPSLHEAFFERYTRLEYSQKNVYLYHFVP